LTYTFHDTITAIADRPIEPLSDNWNRNPRGIIAARGMSVGIFSNQIAIDELI
jgi:hypothetical protein